MIDGINTQMNAKYGTLDQYIPTGSSNVVLKGPNSTTVYTPKDFVSFNEKVKNYVTA
jgi:hypothetical protein